MPTDPIPLDPAQQARRDFARLALAEARSADLAMVGEVLSARAEVSRPGSP